MRTGIVIVAGGEARRLPGKLERDAGGAPLIVRVYRNLCGEFPVAISARASFSADVDAALRCPVVVDRWADRGPLGGIMSAFGALRYERIFAVAADLPDVTLDVLHALANAWEPGDEAAVPEHGGLLEPLAALYDRAAFMREGWKAMAGRAYALHRVLEGLQTRKVRLPHGFFANINTPADLARIGDRTSKGQS